MHASIHALMVFVYHVCVYVCVCVCVGMCLSMLGVHFNINIEITSALYLNLARVLLWA